MIIWLFACGAMALGLAFAGVQNRTHLIVVLCAMSVACFTLAGAHIAERGIAEVLDRLSTVCAE